MRMRMNIQHPTPNIQRVAFNAQWVRTRSYERERVDETQRMSQQKIGVGC